MSVTNNAIGIKAVQVPAKPGVPDDDKILSLPEPVSVGTDHHRASTNTPE